MINKIPAFVLAACNCLGKNNYEAYIVGGAVRDTIMGREPHDWDIATNARPDDIERIFADANIATIPTGKQYGTITVIIDDTPIEITTYRGRESYSPDTLVCCNCGQIILPGFTDKCICGSSSFRRAPRARIVEFGNSIDTDLAYRDFTINAIAYDPIKDTCIDPYNGRKDINDCVIRAVGNPKERFEEDPLRMLRAIRLATQLEFCIDPQIMSVITEKHSSLSNISKERIRMELDKILVCDSSILLSKLNTMVNSGVLGMIIPELMKGHGMTQCGSHIWTVLDHNIRACCAMPPILEWRLAGLLHDVGKPYVVSDDPVSGRHFYQHEYKGEIITSQIMNRLRYSNSQISFVKLLVRNHMWVYNKDSTLSVARRIIARVGEENIPALIALRKADRSASGRVGSGGSTKRLLKAINILKEEESAFKISDLKVSGYDIIDLGLTPGPEIGRVLKELLNSVLDGKIANDRSELINLASEIILTSNST